MKNGKWNMESETENILTAYAEFTMANRKSCLSALKVGQALLKAKARVKAKKGKWEIYVKSELSNIAYWEAKDHMFLFSHYQKNKLPGLLWLNQTNLKKLYQICKDESPEIILEEHGVELPTKVASDDEIENFSTKNH